MRCAVLLSAQDEMARGGYRTLMIADKEMSLDEYEEWQADYAAASVSRFGPCCAWAADHVAALAGAGASGHTARGGSAGRTDHNEWAGLVDSWPGSGALGDA